MEIQSVFGYFSTNVRHGEKKEQCVNTSEIFKIQRNGVQAKWRTKRKNMESNEKAAENTPSEMENNA